MGRRVVCSYSHNNPGGFKPAVSGGHVICSGCVQGLRRDVEGLPDLYQDLENLAINPSGGASGEPAVGGTRDRGLKYNSRALELMDQIRLDLWMTLRAYGGTVRISHGDGITVMCNRLYPLVRAVIASDVEAGAVRRTFRELHIAGARVLDPDRRPVIVGDCPEGCGGTLQVTIRVDRGLSTMDCDGCGISLPPAQWAAFGVKHGYV